MNTLRLSTFSLTIVLFTMGALILPVNTALADHCKGKHKNDPGCDASAINYTVKLTGAFEFDTVNNSVDVTANKQGNVLKSADAVTLKRPTDTALQEIWDSVFLKCPNFFEFIAPPMVNVPGFKAPAGRKGWTIEKPGGVRVIFRDIPFPQEDFAGFLNVESAWVALSLIGDEDFDEPFPPTKTIRLSHFTIHGQTESGVTPRLACDDENFAKEDFTMPTPIFLTITGPN